MPWPGKIVHVDGYLHDVVRDASGGTTCIILVEDIDSLASGILPNSARTGAIHGELSHLLVRVRTTISIHCQVLASASLRSIHPLSQLSPIQPRQAHPTHHLHPKIPTPLLPVLTLRRRWTVVLLRSDPTHAQQKSNRLCNLYPLQSLPMYYSLSLLLSNVYYNLPAHDPRTHLHCPCPSAHRLSVFRLPRLPCGARVDV